MSVSQSKHRSIKLLALLTLGATALTGCAQLYSRAEATSTPYGLLELDDNGPFEASTWAVTPANGGPQVTLGKCEKPDIFSQLKCTSADGVYIFQYSVRKGSVRKATLTMDGREIGLTCSKTSYEPGSTRVCLPKAE